MYVCVTDVCVSVCVFVHASACLLPIEASREWWIPGSKVSDSWEPPLGLEPTDTQKGKQVLLTTEPSL